MALRQTLKDVREVVKGMDNMPLQKDILELHGEVMSLYEENEELKTENKRLKTAFDRKKNLKIGNGHLWEVGKSDKVKGGPYCVPCWEMNQQVLSLIRCSNDVDMQCPTCKMPIMPQNPPEVFENKAYA